jgi:hypothetical protein
MPPVVTSPLLLLLLLLSCMNCRAPEGWAYSSGFINEDMLQNCRTILKLAFSQTTY